MRKQLKSIKSDSDFGEKEKKKDFEEIDREK